MLNYSEDVFLYSNTAYSTADLKAFCLKSLDDAKAINTVSIDVSKFSSITDEMIITTGTSNRHVSGMAHRLVYDLSTKHDIHGVNVSGEFEGKWVVLDLGSVVVHIMQESERQRYQLENLYSCMASGMSEDEALEQALDF